jgi:hypothetical protein
VAKPAAAFLQSVRRLQQRLVRPQDRMSDRLEVQVVSPKVMRRRLVTMSLAALVGGAALSCREDAEPSAVVPIASSSRPSPAPWEVPVPQRWDDSPVQTDTVVYRLERRPGEYRAIVVARYTNRTASPVYFARCTAAYTTPMFWIKRTGPDSTRRFFVDWGWACHGQVPPGELRSGATVTVAVSFGSVDQPSMRPPLQPGDLIGRFRLYFDLCTRPAGATFCDATLPLGERISNEFEVVY